MKTMKLQDLLAPTWLERARAEDALFLETLNFPDDGSPWPEEVQEEIRLLKPTPEIFLSALVVFWADVALQQYNERMKPFKKRNAPTLDPHVIEAWSSPHASQFPMTPATVPLSADLMRGIWIWKFISRLGSYASSIERQLLACLEHPEVWTSAEAAFGTTNTLSDDGFIKFLAAGERRGRGYKIWERARITAKHVHGKRIAILLDGLEPGAAESLTLMRFEIIGKLTGDVAHIAYQHVLNRFPATWSDTQLAQLIRALEPLSQQFGFDPKAILEARLLVRHPNEELQCAVFSFLAKHSPTEHNDVLQVNSSTHPWVLGSLCQGLMEHPLVPADLLHTIGSLCLGNYDGYDGLPHDSAVDLLTASERNAHCALPEIIAWWDQASSENYVDREEIMDALKFAKVLGDAAIPLKAGFERALASQLPEVEPEEWPAIDQPGAIPEILSRMEASMTEAGTPKKETLAVANFYGGIFEAINENAEQWQKDIDESQAKFEAEQRELYPERFLTEEQADYDEDENEFMPEEEDELLVQLRDVIAKLNDVR